ncbi:MAG TPA: response regulator [Terriglobales bacterium]|nr:response regulator [Terriglobales bacterium]
MDVQRKTILIVDDDEQVLIELERLLENQGYSTTTAWSGREGLDLLQSRSFDFVLLDGDLPDLTSEELIRQVGQRSKSHCIVLQPQSRFRPESTAENSVCKREHNAILSKLRECLSGQEQVRAGKRAGNVA